MPSFLISFQLIRSHWRVYRRSCARYQSINALYEPESALCTGAYQCINKVYIHDTRIHTTDNRRTDWRTGCARVLIAHRSSKLCTPANAATMRCYTRIASLRSCVLRRGHVYHVLYYTHTHTNTAISRERARASTAWWSVACQTRVLSYNMAIINQQSKYEVYAHCTRVLFARRPDGRVRLLAAIARARTRTGAINHTIGECSRHARTHGMNSAGGLLYMTIADAATLVLLECERRCSFTFLCGVCECAARCASDDVRIHLECILSVDIRLYWPCNERFAKRLVRIYRPCVARTITTTTRTKSHHRSAHGDFGVYLFNNFRTGAYMRWVRV